MLWCHFFDAFWDWSDSTRKTKISSLEDIGIGDEVVEVVLEIEDPKVKAQLIRKAIKLGVEFTQDDFMNLDGELSEELYVQLAEYGGFDADDPYFDEDNMDWDDFYNCWSNWSDEVLARRIGKLTNFGPADEVEEAIINMPTTETWDALFDRAIAHGVRFTPEHLEEMGEWCEDEMDDSEVVDAAMHFEENLHELTIALDTTMESKKRKSGRLGLQLGTSVASQKKKKLGFCDGDCANCPPHFGYRYGRWYYGRGHQYGCMRGGNGGAKGKVNMD